MMFKILILSLCALHCYAIPGYGRSLGGYGGYGSLINGYGGGGGHYSGGAHVNGAVISHRNIDYVYVPTHYSKSEPTIVDVDSGEQPVVLNFRSRSSPLHTNQNHYGQPGGHQSSHSVDEAHVLSHEVMRPVLQEIREIIVPQRKVVQEIRPVLENVKTIVSKGEPRGKLYMESDLGSGLEYGSVGKGYGVRSSYAPGSLGYAMESRDSVKEWFQAQHGY